MKVGEEQWQLQECYNCHKLKGEGGKKRGPELDNIGNAAHGRRDQAKNYWIPRVSWLKGLRKSTRRARCPTSIKI